MSALDELRDAMVGLALDLTQSHSDAGYAERFGCNRCIALLDAFEAVHPGLVDGTWKCSCGSVYKQYRALSQDGSGFTTCYACAKESK